MRFRMLQVNQDHTSGPHEETAGPNALLSLLANVYKNCKIT